MKKKIAWGGSKLYEMFVAQSETNPFVYCVDNHTSNKECGGVEVKKTEDLAKETIGSYEVVIFAVSNKALQEISLILNSLGLVYKKDYIYYSDFFYQDFKEKVKNGLGLVLDERLYELALSFTLQSRVSIHTTILGTWLFLELLKQVNDIKGSVAELGAFEGGNALCGLHFLSSLNSKKMFICDSFEGFPELSDYDPATFTGGDYAIESSFQEIVDRFKIFPNASVVKGFIPESLEDIPSDEKFSIVFYDCDLYQPALDTFDYFWDKIVPGGYLIIHDYEVQEGGFVGVKKATDSFFDDKDVKIVSFFENTMAVIQKK